MSSQIQATPGSDATAARINHWRPNARVLQQLRLGPKMDVFGGVDDRLLFSMPKALAAHFSPMWRREIQGTDTRAVHIVAPVAALRFAHDWMFCGGVDRVGPGAVPWPQHDGPKLDCLARLAAELGIEPLVERASTDLAALEEAETVRARAAVAATTSARVLPPTRPVKPTRNVPVISGPRKQRALAEQRCFRCGMQDHVAADCPDPKETIGRCWDCLERGHMANNCPQRQAQREEEQRIQNATFAHRSKTEGPQGAPAQSVAQPVLAANIPVPLSDPPIQAPPEQTRPQAPVTPAQDPTTALPPASVSQNPASQAPVPDASAAQSPLSWINRFASPSAGRMAVIYDDGELSGWQNVGFWIQGEPSESGEIVFSGVATIHQQQQQQSS